MFENAITRAVADVDERLATLDADALAKVEGAATLDAAEWLALGDKASRANQEGLVDLASANTLHSIHTNFNHGATLAQRVVFLQFAAEYLARVVGK